MIQNNIFKLKNSQKIEKIFKKLIKLSFKKRKKNFEKRSGFTLNAQNDGKIVQNDILSHRKAEKKTTKNKRYNKKNRSKI